MHNKENHNHKANCIHQSITHKPPSKQSEKPINDLKSCREALISMNELRQKSQNKYELVISKLEELIQELLQKNNFLNADRNILLQQQNQLKRKNGSLNNIIDVKQGLGQNMAFDSAELFQILVESGTVSRADFKHQDSYQFQQENYTEQNSHIFQKQQMVIESVPLSYNISRIDQNQISMSNIGPTINPTNLNTPSLKTQNVYIQCNLKVEGVIRAFYLSVIQKKQPTGHLIDIVDSLRNDITTTIYEPYPNNQFWADMLCNFLRIIHRDHFDSQVEILQYIKVHKLIDTLLIKCLKSRIQFLFEGKSYHQQPETQQILASLANQFGMKMEGFVGQQYIFFCRESEEKQFNLLQSQRVSNQGSMIQTAKNQQPTFTIYEREECLQFPFFIVGETSQRGLSQFQMKQVLQFQQQLHSFRCSQQNNRTVLWNEKNSQSNEESSVMGSVLLERNMNTFQLQRRKFKILQQDDDDDDNKIKERLDSSRFFLNRVGSKRSDFEQSA